MLFLNDGRLLKKERQGTHLVKNASVPTAAKNIKNTLYAKRTTNTTSYLEPNRTVYSLRRESAHKNKQSTSLTNCIT